MPADFLGQRPTPRHIAWSERRDNVFRIYIVPNIYGLDIEFRYGRELEPDPPPAEFSADAA
jgi:hypothetical protein